MKTAIARLRAKTDRDLGVLIRRELDQMQSLAAHGRYIEAARLSRQIQALVVVSNLSAQERERVERMLYLPATACA